MDLLTWLGLGGAFVASLLAEAVVHSQVMKFAIKRKIVDSPNGRKLQREPVPVLGGVAVFFGIVVGMSVSSLFLGVGIASLLPILLGVSMMLCVGIADDVSGLTPRLRFAIEILVTIMLVFITGTSLNDFQGLWGIREIPLWVSIPLTIVAVVGIINAINLVDGVDGLSSGYCILASAAFGLLYLKAGDIPMLLLCVISIGSLLSFFFHNVFGRKTKMFIGDGGSLMMGVVMSAYVVVAISSDGSCEKFSACGVGLVPFTLAVMCVPVFDTVRVMVMRILRHTSPFHPDKTHLHHLFIELGFSHVGTTASVLSLNLLVVLCWWLSFELGASVDVQFYVVMASGLLVTAGFYKFMRVQKSCDGAIWRFMQRIGAKTKVENNKGWLALQKMVDRGYPPRISKKSHIQ